MHSILEPVDTPTDAPTDAPTGAPTGLTLTVSSLHVAGADLDRLRQKDWPLTHCMMPGRICLALASDGAPGDLFDELQKRGYSKTFLGLLGWAAAGGNHWLLVDDDAELDDKLLLFVG